MDKEVFKNKLTYAMEEVENKNNENKKISMLEELSLIEFEQLKKLKSINSSDKENAQIEINKSNAMANTSKIILQSIGTQLIVEKNQKQILSFK